ncbi:cyclic lactone autoinducer peptide AgrD [Staphylococcus cohnii]|nr:MULTISPECIES: cyclic lactone autoinducer peptide [Staphylococcus]PTE75208.1 cyclic lactone autoinducer peptide [Staphylococcus cohnii]PTF35850.1 cyclic lactone autoinducer peptide [Staphylococcus cohnii]RIL72421.1 cyclic lactone autoinducer peptide [Staphylococcus cohnii]RIL91258.1 cyclic lactone autoinducer peptide [Staphylococcus cohnii]
MHIFESIVNLFVKFFSVLGAVSGGKVCSAFFDEPEVPKEITDLYK